MNKSVFILVVIFALMIGACGSVSSQPGGSAPDFTLESTDGRQIVLSDVLSGKNAVLVFFATWCPHCVSEVPAVNEYNSKYGASVQVIGINIRESKAKVASFIDNKNVEYMIVLDTDGAVAAKYNVRGIPAVFAVAKDGTILYSGHSIEEMETMVKFE